MPSLSLTFIFSRTFIFKKPKFPSKQPFLALYLVKRMNSSKKDENSNEPNLVHVLGYSPSRGPDDEPIPFRGLEVFSSYSYPVPVIVFYRKFAVPFLITDNVTAEIYMRMHVTRYKNRIFFR